MCAWLSVWTRSLTRFEEFTVSSPICSDPILTIPLSKWAPGDLDTPAAAATDNTPLVTTKLQKQQRRRQSHLDFFDHTISPLQDEGVLDNSVNESGYNDNSDDVDGVDTVRQSLENTRLSVSSVLSVEALWVDGGV